jgi:hypothetical protein
MELGQAISRTGFPELFNAVCPVFNGAVVQAGNAWVIMPSRPDGLAPTTGIRVGIPVESPGAITQSTTVISIHPTNPWIQLSVAPSGNGSSIRLFPHSGGAGTFNIPDSRGTVVAGLDPQNSTARLTANTSQGITAANVGSYGGEQAHVISINEMAAHQHAYYITDQGHSHYEYSLQNIATAGSPTSYGGGYSNTSQSAATTSSGANLLSGSSPGANDSVTSVFGNGWAHNNVQPTQIRLKIIYAGRATF